MKISKVAPRFTALALIAMPISFVFAAPQTCNIENRPVMLLDVELVGRRTSMICAPALFNPSDKEVTLEYSWRFKGTDLDESQFDGGSSIFYRSLFFAAHFEAQCRVTVIDEDGNAQTRWSNKLRTDNLYKRVFSTRTQVQGNFGSVQAGDELCQIEAQQYGMPGIYKAWLSDDTTMPYESFTGWDVAYLDAEGEVFVREWGWLTGDTSPSGYPDIEDPRKMDRPFLYADFDMTPWEERPEYVWTGTFYNGKNFVPDWYDPFELTNCSGWTGVGTGQVGRNSGGSSHSFTLYGWKNCDLLASLQCFEQ